MTLVSMVEGLAAADIRVVLVGGMAVRAHGVPRLTDDVDVCYDTGYFNERVLVKLLQSWHAYPRDAAPGHPYRLTRAYLQAHDTVRLQTVHGFLDVMREVPGVGTYHDIVAHADTMRLANGMEVPLISLEQLIRAKETADRPKDREVLHELRAVRATKRLSDLGLPIDDPAPAPATPRATAAPDDPPRARKGRRR